MMKHIYFWIIILAVLFRILFAVFNFKTVKSKVTTYLKHNFSYLYVQPFFWNINGKKFLVMIGETTEELITCTHVCIIKVNEKMRVEKEYINCNCFDYGYRKADTKYHFELISKEYTDTMLELLYEEEYPYITTKNINLTNCDEYPKD